MRRVHVILMALVGAAVVAFCASPAARGDRVGGPITMVQTIGPNQTLTYDFNFMAGRRAVVAITGNNQTNLDLRIYDGNGSVTIAGGNGDQKAAYFNVSRTGTFRAEVHNLGPRSNTFYLMTN